MAISYCAAQARVAYEYCIGYALCMVLILCCIATRRAKCGMLSTQTMLLSSISREGLGCVHDARGLRMAVHWQTLG